MLGRALGGGKLGVRFLRQVPVGPFIVDFLATSARLIVEVDGPYHHCREAADARRTRKLERAGYRVVRVSNEEVREDMRGVLRAITVAVRAPASFSR